MATQSRRIFVTDGASHFQVCSLTQNKNDGSIYLSAPDFASVQWWLPAVGSDGKPALREVKSPWDGKLSLHGSGQTHVRPFSGEGDARLVVQGRALKDERNQTLGVRHMCTIMWSKPTHLPTSPAFSRASDYSVSIKSLAPYVFVFWAIPATKKLQVTVNFGFHVDDLTGLPPEGGFGGFGLALHAVVWFAYRTKHMERWPAGPLVSYFDGYFVPVFIGTSVGNARLELRKPEFTLDESKLLINVPRPEDGRA
ncbi:MAG: hypothetical protein AAB074_06325 [Planctomycetota bacterium]